ncbi:hypothetical protein HYPSUDRAFT_1017407 [Hypholoma sublateritium FD-334 SS-4]|uniref:Uncharacterized protein n=1 Tax=Hypholoma sublateritium (strain FD-334 SS-4) TaxID=945553 RepID=A0A0D2NEF6_HYPSF|nr:hypothetical protein HYPSUDRAFT_1017407 [Hypholoma sublateritium FD-334 SS-4]
MLKSAEAPSSWWACGWDGSWGCRWSNLCICFHWAWFGPGLLFLLSLPARAPGRLDLVVEHPPRRRFKWRVEKSILFFKMRLSSYHLLVFYLVFRLIFTIYVRARLYHGLTLDMNRISWMSIWCNLRRFGICSQSANRHSVMVGSVHRS